MFQANCVFFPITCRSVGQTFLQPFPSSVSKTHSFSGDSLWSNFPAVAALRLPTTQAIVRPVRRSKAWRIHLLFFLDLKKCHLWSISISLIFSSLTGGPTIPRLDAASYRQLLLKHQTVGLKNESWLCQVHLARHLRLALAGLICC